MHHIVHAATLPEAYHQALLILNDYGEKRPCPAYDTHEKSVSITIDIARPLMEPRISKLIPCDPGALQQYLMEMEDGIMDFEYTVAKNWPYTYHNRMIEQLIEVVKILKKDPFSRRAVVCIRRPGDVDMDDPPCLQLIQYILNDGMLDCYVTFRSNDAVKAFFMNAFALIDIQRIVSDVLEVPIGRYIHTANSFHCYERDWDRLKEFANRIREASGITFWNDSRIYESVKKENLTMNYKDEWQDMMLEEVPMIMEKVSQQMKKYGQSRPGLYVGTLEDILRREDW